MTNTGSATTFSLSLVPVAGTAGTANRLFNSLAIGANETILLDVSQVMTSGDFISVKSGAGSTVNVTISGVENAGAMVISGLADSAVTTAKIADGSVTGAKIASNPTISLPSIDNIKLGYTTTVTSLGTVFITSSSNHQQFFTGSSNHGVALPVASTMTLGQSFSFENNSTGYITINAANTDFVAGLWPGTTVLITCILASGSTASSWDADYVGFSTITGTGSNVLSASPTFTGTVNADIISTTGTIATNGRGEFRTVASAGRGVGIGGGTSDTPAILQFVNNAFGSQWGTITASSAFALAINAYDGTAGSIALNASSITTSTPITGSAPQVIHNIYATNYSRTSTAGQADITGWSMSITPKKAGNKIIILVQAALMSICDGYLYLKKNGSLLANPLISVPRVDFSYDDATFFGQYVDTAASTSTITYQFSAQATGCQGFFGVNSQGGVSSTIMIEVQS